MNTKVIVTKRDDGGCDITIPAPNMFDENSKDRKLLAEKNILIAASDEEVLLWIKNKDAPQGRLTDISNIPKDRVFRNAWTDDNDTETVDIDIPKAQELKKDEMRRLRKPLLEALDTEFILAVEQDDENKKIIIISQKQELRDVTKLELPTDVEELKSFIPDCLSKEG
jgi:hypothetical protein